MVYKYTEIATKNNVILADDEQFELHVFPNGNWRILFLDIDFSNIDHRNNPEIVKKDNTKFAQRTLADWEESYRILVNQISNSKLTTLLLNIKKKLSHSNS